MRISDWSSDVCSSDLTPGSQWPSAMPTIMHSATHSVSQRSNVFMAGFDGPMAASDMAFLSGDALAAGVDQIGRASCRERVCQYVEISVVAGSLNNNSNQHNY